MSLNIEKDLAALSLSEEEAHAPSTAKPTPTVSDKDDVEDEVHEAYTITEVDLVEFEQEHGERRIFTRQVLGEIAQKKELALRELKKPLHKRQEAITARCPFIGNERNIFILDTPHANTIDVQYLTRSELHPEIQRFVGPEAASPKVELLDRYNAIDRAEARDLWIPSPYVFGCYLSSTASTLPDAKILNLWRSHLHETQDLWHESVACERILNVFRDVSRWSVPIKRIVCFGLGALDFRARSYQGVLQHLAAFDIAAALDEIYQAADATTPKIEIFAQDPCYLEQDHLLLRDLCPDLQFVEDPYGLLKIDKNTLVISAFVPIGFPLMQIIADMFPPGEGPAGFIVDEMKRNPKRRLFNHRTRVTPGVIRMLQPYKSYLNWLGGEDMGTELKENVFRKQTGLHYWLEDMKVWIRPEAAPKPVPRPSEVETAKGSYYSVLNSEESL